MDILKGTIIQTLPLKLINYIKGPFNQQHDVDIISNKEISIFNNNNFLINNEYSEILIYNFETGLFSKMFNEQLKEIHGIDLLTVTAKDLEIPLVSVAVMEAYTASTPKPIPTDPVEQALYYVDTYVKYDKAKLIKELGEEKGIETYNRKRNESIENFLVNNGFRTEWNEYSTNN